MNVTELREKLEYTVAVCILTCIIFFTVFQLRLDRNCLCLPNLTLKSKPGELSTRQDGLEKYFSPASSPWFLRNPTSWQFHFSFCFPNRKQFRRAHDILRGHRAIIEWLFDCSELKHISSPGISYHFKPRNKKWVLQSELPNPG